MIFAFSTNLILRMLTKQEKFFLEYWEKKQGERKKSLRYVFLGLPFGFIIGIAILLLLSSNWYERAVMVAHSEVNPFIFLIAILSIAVFCGIFYKKYKWEKEMNSIIANCCKKEKKKIRRLPMQLINL